MEVTTTDRNWAAALTNGRLASDLRRLAESIRFHSPAERAALLEEAAKRLGPRTTRVEGVEIRRSDREFMGSCSACRSKEDVVEIRLGSSVVRVCSSHRAALKAEL